MTALMLDDTDLAILAELTRDARASFAQIGARVSLSASAVKRRVDRLLRAGAITGFTVQLDEQALGWTCHAYVELFCQGSVSPARLRGSTLAIPEVTHTATVTGDADAIVQVRAHSTRHLEQVVERLNALPFVARTKTTIMLSELVRRPNPAAARPIPPA